MCVVARFLWPSASCGVDGVAHLPGVLARNGDVINDWRLLVRSVMRKPSLPLLFIVASLFITALIDFVLEPSFNVSILYAIPLAIAGTYSSLRTVVVTGVVALALNVVSLYLDQLPFALWPYSLVAMFLVTVLAAQSAEWRRRERRRALEAEEAREQLREFMGMVVHDLRGPLTVGLGFIQVVRRRMERVDDEITQRSLIKAETALLTMRRLVNDLLDSTRIGRARFVIREEPVDLAELARSVVEELQGTSTDHQLVVDAPPRLVGAWDAERLRQVFTNLLSNAVKYSPANTEVRVTLRETGETVLLSVADQGSGITPVHIAELFQPFSRLGRERQATGTGLGLYITKGIVEAHGGRIWVESEGGKGSTFVVALPRHEPRSTSAQTRAS
jgi:signal transduction histidine kinase